MKKKYLTLFLAVILGLTIVSLNSCNDDKESDESTSTSSLTGTWKNSSGTYEFTINGSSGTFTNLSPSTSGTPYWYEAMQAGFIKLGDKNLRNLVSTGNNTWKGDVLVNEYYTGTMTITDVYWEGCNISLSSDGKSFYLVTETGLSGNYYRK